MKNSRNWLFSVLVLVLLFSGCSKPVKDEQGRTLPSLGSAARFTDNSGLVATTEEAMHELITPTGVRESVQTMISKGMNSEQIARELSRMADEQEKQAVERVLKAGTAFKISPGTKVQVIGYLNHGLVPLQARDPFASIAKVEILEGSEKGRTGFVAAGSLVNN